MLIRDGGPLARRQTENGRREMIAAARRLSPLSPPPDDSGAEVHYLTGSKYWYQTVFCHASLQINCPSRITPVIYDDGTLDANHQGEIRRIVPWARMVTISEIEAQLDIALPWSRYPILRQRRLAQPLIRKVLDLHAGQTGWKMLLDSDMLFFRHPLWLLDWLAQPQNPAYMIDAIEAYGYSTELRSRICGQTSFPTRANIGIFGWRSEDLDFDWLEWAVGELLRCAGTHYNLTQGIASMLFAGRPCDPAPAEDYVVLPSLAEGRNPTAVLHHYVAQSKRSYFQHGWRIVFERLNRQAIGEHQRPGLRA
ncbi:MAG: hypothetical protein ACKVP4_14460 [Hyphomicrobium sp.]